MPRAPNAVRSLISLTSLQALLTGPSQPFSRLSRRKTNSPSLLNCTLTLNSNCRTIRVGSRIPTAALLLQIWKGGRVHVLESGRQNLHPSPSVRCSPRCSPFQASTTGPLHLSNLKFTTFTGFASLRALRSGCVPAPVRRWSVSLVRSRTERRVWVGRRGQSSLDLSEDTPPMDTKQLLGSAGTARKSK